MMIEISMGGINRLHNKIIREWKKHTKKSEAKKTGIKWWEKECVKKEKARKKDLLGW